MSDFPTGSQTGHGTVQVCFLISLFLSLGLRLCCSLPLIHLNPSYPLVHSLSISFYSGFCWRKRRPMFLSSGSSAAKWLPHQRCCCHHPIHLKRHGNKSRQRETQLHKLRQKNKRANHNVAPVYGPFLARGSERTGSCGRLPNVVQPAGWRRHQTMNVLRSSGKKTKVVEQWRHLLTGFTG